MNETDLDFMAWRETPRTVTLTNHEWSTLSSRVYSVIRDLETERDEWLELEGQKHPDGTPMYKTAAGMADHWQGYIDELKTILSKIDSKEG